MTDAVKFPALVALSDLKPAPWNPRLLREERFKNLCRSVAIDPSFLWRRCVLASEDGTIYAGNMRFRVVEHLWKNGVPDSSGYSDTEIDWKWKAKAAGIDPGTVPAILEDVSEQVAKERSLRDNQQWGEWQEQELAEMLYELSQNDTDISALGFDDRELSELLDLIGVGPDVPPAEDDIPVDSSHVAFKFGTITGKVEVSTYERFAERYRDAQKESKSLNDVVKDLVKIGG